MEGSKEKAEPKIPPEWRTIPIQEYFSEGFKPQIYRKSNGKRYIVLRKGDRKISLGPYTDERWELIRSMYPRRLDEPPKVDLPPKLFPARNKSGMIVTTLRAKIATKMPQSIDLSLKTLLYYEWAKSKGFPGDLSEFINQVCEAYFKEHGIEPVILVEEGGED